MDAIQCCPHTFQQLYELTGRHSCKQSKFQINRMKFITFQKKSYKLDEIHYIFRTNHTKTYCKPNLNDRRRPTIMSGHEPEKAAIAFASSSSTSITSSSGAQGSEDFRLHVTVKRLIGRRCLSHQAWRRLSGGAVAFLGLERQRPTMYYSSTLPAALVHAHRLRRSGSRGWPGESRRSPSSAPATVRPGELRSAPGAEPPISFVCSCDSTSKRALERQEAMVGVVPTEGRDRRRMSVGLWLWLGAGDQVNIVGEWQ